MRHRKPDAATADAKKEHRSIALVWLPRSKKEWATFSTVRLAAGREWTMLVEYHKAARETGGKWPTHSELRALVHGKFPELHSQTSQQIVDDFYENITATTAKRKAQAKRGEKITAEYPHAAQKYHQVIYTNQGARIKDGYLCLSNGKKTPGLRIPLPKGRELPGRLMEVKLGMGQLHLVCEFDPPAEKKFDEKAVVEIVAGDPGVNSSIAVTNGERVVIVSGRAAKAIVQGRNKQLAEIQAAMSKLKKGSKRWTALNRRKAEMLAKNARRITDLTHKVTARVKKEFPGAKLYIGESFQDGAQTMRRVQAQQVSQCCTGRMTRQFQYKMPGTEVIPEPHSSRTCPTCLRRKRKCRDRIFRCKNPLCGLVAPRDAIGAVNIRSLALYGEIRKQTMPTNILFVRPLKYPGRRPCPPGSSGGTPASSSAAKTPCESESTRSLTL